ncbi:putative histamine-gated chloride channel, his-9 [Ixodes scapularis]
MVTAIKLRPSAILALVVFPMGLAECDKLAKEKFVSNEQQLRRKLLDPLTYDVNRRPTNQSSLPTPVNVFTGFAKYIVLESDSFTVDTHLCVNWKDPLLVWNADEYGGLEGINLRPGEAWFPNIRAINTVLNDHLSMPTTAYLDHNGEVWYCPPSKIKVACGMDVRRFPFDAHICKIRLSSEDDQVKLSGRPLHPSALPLSRNASSVWSLKSITFSDSQVLNMACLDIAFEVERRSHHYLYDVTLPWASSFVLTLVVFWMPADSDRRLTLVGLNLVFITQIMWRVTSLFGTSITSPRIVIYLGNAILIEAIVAVSTVVILNMATAPVPARIPDAVVRFLSGPVGPLLCLRHYSELGEVEPTGVESIADEKNREKNAKDWLLLVEALNRALFLVFLVSSLAIIPF